MTRYCKDCYINYYYNFQKNYNNCGFFKSIKPRKLDLNLSSKFVVLRSIIKKSPNSFEVNHKERYNFDQ